MFPAMRRFKQELDQEEVEKILASGQYGILAVSGADGYPYTVPLNYLYQQGKFYFHSAKEGHKLSALISDNRVSFCVVDKADLVEEEYTTYFRSVVAFGRIRLIEEEEEREKWMRELALKFRPGHPDDLTKELARSKRDYLILELEVDHMTGKQAIELVRKG